MRQITDPRQKADIFQKYKIARYFDDLSVYRDYLTVCETKKNDFFLNELLLKDRMIFYVKGHFNVYSELENGTRKLLRSCASPMLLGEVELFEPEEDRDLMLTVEARDRGIVILLNTAPVCEQLMRDVTFLRTVCRSLVEKMKVFGTSETKNTLQPAGIRVEDYVRAHADPDGYFKMNLRHAAEELNISYRHLMRVLAEMVSEGVLEKTEGKYRLKPAAK